MPRKKATKSKISKTNRKTMYLSENMENDFRSLPNKLPVQLNKELDGLKKQENKLQSSLLKMQKQQAIAKNKHAVLTSKSKNNLTSVAKKQINAAKKTLEMLNNAALKLAAQLNDVKQHGKLLSQKQAKFSEICKQIALIEKKWEKKYSKAEKVTVKAKSATNKKPRKKVKIADELIIDSLHKSEPLNIEMIPETVEASSKNE